MISPEALTSSNSGRPGPPPLRSPAARRARRKVATALGGAPAEPRSRDPTMPRGALYRKSQPRTTGRDAPPRPFSQAQGARRGPGHPSPTDRRRDRFGNVREDCRVANFVDLGVPASVLARPGVMRFWSHGSLTRSGGSPRISEGRMGARGPLALGSREAGAFTGGAKFAELPETRSRPSRSIPSAPGGSMLALHLGTLRNVSLPIALPALALKDCSDGPSSDEDVQRVAGDVGALAGTPDAASTITFTTFTDDVGA